LIVDLPTISGIARGTASATHMSPTEPPKIDSAAIAPDAAANAPYRVVVRA